MEAKSEGKSTYDGFDDVDEVDLDPGRSLVMKMCQHAFKVLNSDMEDFFEENADLFDQEDEDLTSGRGETIQQYNIFKLYEGQLESKFDDFAVSEGFSSSYECFNAVKSAVKSDLIAQKAMMEKLAAQLREAQKQWQRANQAAITGDDINDSSKPDADSKSAKEVSAKASKEVDDEEESEAAIAPIMLFFQPMSLENLVETTLSIADYRTFSYIMRMKIKQKKMVSDMKAKVAAHQQKSIERKRILNANRDISPVYIDLIDRVCSLTPHRPDIIQNVRNSFPITKWEELMEADLDEKETKDGLKQLFTTLFMRLSQMGSFEDLQAIKKHISDFHTAIDLNDGTVVEISSRFLLICHTFVDKVENKIYEMMTLSDRQRQSGAISTAAAGKSNDTRDAKYSGDDDDDDNDNQGRSRSIGKASKK